MSLSLSWLLLTLLGPAEPAVSAPAPAPGTVAPEVRAEQAAALYQQRKYLEAALILEDLWASVHEPRDLFNAGLARLALGHRAHAIHYWELYLQQQGIPHEGREQALDRGKKAQQTTTGIIVRTAPSALSELGVSLVLTRLDNDKDRRPELTIQLPPQAPEFRSGKTIFLDPGKWRLTVLARSYVTSSREITIKPGGSGFVLEVPLGPDPAFRQVKILVGPTGALTAGAQASFRKLTPSAEQVACPVDNAGACEVRIEPGEWELVVQAPGYQQHVEKLNIGAEMTKDLAVALAPSLSVPAPTPTPTPAGASASEGPKPAPAVPELVPKKKRLRLSTGLITAGIPIFITGLGLAVHGSNVYDEKKLTLTANNELLPAIRLRSAGTGLMGAAAGLFATGLTAEYDVKPWLWLTELGVGVAALVGGSAWSAVTTHRWNNDDLKQLACNNNTGVDCFTAHRLGASFFLGLGTSLVVGATTGLIVQRKHRRKAPPLSLSPSFHGTQGGLVLHGRF